MVHDDYYLFGDYGDYILDREDYDDMQVVKAEREAEEDPWQLRHLGVLVGEDLNDAIGHDA